MLRIGDTPAPTHPHRQLRPSSSRSHHRLPSLCRQRLSRHSSTATATRPVATHQGPPSRWHAPSLPWSYGLRRRLTSTLSATCTSLHLVFGTFFHPLPTLCCTTSPPSVEEHPLSSSHDLLGNFLPQAEIKFYNTRSPDPLPDKKIVPWEWWSPLVPCVVSLSCLTLPVRSLILQCVLSCPGYSVCLVLSSM